MNQSNSSMSDLESGTSSKSEEGQTSEKLTNSSSLDSSFLHGEEKSENDNDDGVTEDDSEDWVTEDDSEDWETEDDSKDGVTDEESDKESNESCSIASDASSLLSDTATESNSLSTDYSETDGSLSSLISDNDSDDPSLLGSDFSSDDESPKKKDKEFSLTTSQFVKLIYGVKPGEEGDAKFVRNYAVILWGRNTLAKSSVPGVEADPKEKPRPPLDAKKLDHLKAEWFYYKVICEDMTNKPSKINEADVKKRRDKIDGILAELVRKLAKQRRLQKKVKR